MHTRAYVNRTEMLYHYRQELFVNVISLGAIGFVEAVKGKSELELTVVGRRTKKAHSITVWFFEDGNKIYLLPVNGTGADWYKNALKNPSITLTVGSAFIRAEAEPITEFGRVQKVVELFAKKYGGMSEINKYYKKLDAAIEVALT